MKCTTIEEALYKLKNLTYLNIRNCPFDKNKSKLKDALLFFYSFENLKAIKASNISQQEWDNRDRNEILKERMSPKKIIAILENKNASLITLENALNAIEDLETVFSVNKNDSYDNTLKIEVLDTVVTSNITKLSNQILQKLISVNFADKGMYDSYEVTILVINSIIKLRKKSTRI